VWRAPGWGLPRAARGARRRAASEGEREKWTQVGERCTGVPLKGVVERLGLDSSWNVRYGKDALVP